MKIAILGTRGIPNHYGGFEQCAQYLSLGLVQKGHEVYVYNSHSHPYQQKTWNGVNLIHQKDPENKIGTAGQFLYDLNCILDSRKRGFDVILNLGYTSSSVWGRLFPKKSVVITNMDGLEWKRSKYSKKVQRFLHYAERLGVKHSDALVADSIGIQAYLQKTYGQPSHFIAYGAELFTSPDASFLENYNVSPFGYNMLIARMEPENNIETILDGMHQSATTSPMLVIGNTGNSFGTSLVNKYKGDARIRFCGAEYNIDVLNNLRYFSNLYFHGHSVGGTNPSLLEAMACKSYIAAHRNPFNEAVLGKDAFYFETAAEVTTLLQQTNRPAQDQPAVIHNYHKIKEHYSWPHIVELYENLICSARKK